MVEVWLPYGETEVCVRIPTANLLDIVEPKKMDGKNPQVEIKNALQNPVGTKRLAEIVKPEAKVTIVLKDSGVSANQMLISALMEEIGSAGVNENDVTIIFAYDPIRDSHLYQKSPMLGEELSARLRVVRHSCEADWQVSVGKTSNGIEICLNKLFVEADVKILAGPVEPHPIAGYGGGYEIVLPGVAGLDSIREVFRLGIDGKAVKGNLEGNPVHDEMVEAADLAKVDFTLNIVRDSNLEIVKAFAGNVNETFEKSVRLAEEIYRIPVENRADIVFVSPGGFYFDNSLQEATVCLDGALEIVKRGKAIALIAECASGFGDKEFFEVLSKFRNLRELRRHLEKKFTVPGLMAYRLIKVLQQVNLVVVSVMPEYYLSRILKLKIARTANEAYRLLADTFGNRGKISFIPYGNLTVPFIKT
ncbi:nickel-dependent lactate racemase [Candidatus Bathyarchaeota archaeon]|nr:MAG: nickel-dependent lactate racemase [Candidatus Bathyarchaeota archaeon]